MGKNVALYALITQFISTETIELILHGMRRQIVQVEIITDKREAVCSFIMDKMKRGVSIARVEGAYTGKTREKLILLCSPREELKLRKTLMDVDPHAFVTVIKVQDVWGKGFRPMDDEDEE